MYTVNVPLLYSFYTYSDHVLVIVKLAVGDLRKNSARVWFHCVVFTCAAEDSHETEGSGNNWRPRRG